jgi:hypothetical protein
MLAFALGCGGIDSHDEPQPWCPKYCELRDRCGFTNVNCDALCGWVDTAFKAQHADCYASAQGIMACLLDDPARIECSGDHMTVNVDGCAAWEQRAFCPWVSTPRGAYRLMLNASCPGGSRELTLGSWVTVPTGMATSISDGTRMLVYDLANPIDEVSEASVACESVSATNAFDMSVRIGLSQFSAHSDDVWTNQLSLTYQSPEIGLQTTPQTPCTINNLRASAGFYTGSLDCPAVVVDGATGAACSATGFVYFEVCDAN